MAREIERIKRRRARTVKIGEVLIGGNHPVAIQSMAKTKTAEAEKTIGQIRELEKAGCEIVRLAIKDNADARAIARIKKEIKIPLVADIHFDWRLAIQAIEKGADKVRLNPGNISNRYQIRQIAQAAKEAGIPLRIGLNSGSIGRAKDLVDKMVRSACDYLRILEGVKFYDTVISLKASDIFQTMRAYEKMSRVCDYPFHLGLTATGLPLAGVVKSSIALSNLLLKGIGDTLRVSLTDNPIREAQVAKYILEALGLRNFGAQIISCPTCGRCEVDLKKIVSRLEEALSHKKYLFPKGKPSKIAVMGCVVNGPGEARQADIGLAFGRKEGLLFKKGEPFKKVAFSECAAALLKEMERFYD